MRFQQHFCGLLMTQKAVPLRATLFSSKLKCRAVFSCAYNGLDTFVFGGEDGFCEVSFISLFSVSSFCFVDISASTIKVYKNCRIQCNAKCEFSTFLSKRRFDCTWVKWGLCPCDQSQRRTTSRTKVIISFHCYNNSSIIVLGFIKAVRLFANATHQVVLMLLPTQNLQCIRNKKNIVLMLLG